MLKLVSIFGIIALFGDAYCRPQLRAEDLEPFLDNPQALEEFGEILAAEIRSGKPSDLVAAGLGVQNATLIDLLPGANLGKDVVAGGVQAVFNNPPLVRIVVGAATANQSQIIEDATNIATDGINLAADGITLAAEVAQNTTRVVGEGLAERSNDAMKPMGDGLSFLENMFSLLFNANPEDNEDIDEEDNDGELEENPDKSEPKSNQVGVEDEPKSAGPATLDDEGRFDFQEEDLSPRANQDELQSPVVQ